MLECDKISDEISCIRCNVIVYLMKTEDLPPTIGQKEGRGCPRQRNAGTVNRWVGLENHVVGKG
jgi:hypothetical protein